MPIFSFVFVISFSFISDFAKTLFHVPFTNSQFLATNLHLSLICIDKKDKETSNPRFHFSLLEPYSSIHTLPDIGSNCTIPPLPTAVLNKLHFTIFKIYQTKHSVF